MAFTLISPNQTYQVLNTIQAAAADFELVGGVISVGDPLETLCRYNDVIDAKIIPAQAETLQVRTLTPVAANNSTYAFWIRQLNPFTGAYYYWEGSTTTPASGGTATTIGDAFRASINAQTAAGNLKVAATGTTTLILTATTGYPVFETGFIELGGGFTAAATTPGVVAIGTAALLESIGIEGATAGPYTAVVITYARIMGYNNTDPERQRSTFTWYLNEADSTDYADLVEVIEYSLSGRTVSAGGVANPEAIAII